MNSRSLFVVVSGLAGSGKTSLAEPLAQALSLPLISKDAIKEALFEAFGHGGWALSKTLSRAADAALVQFFSPQRCCHSPRLARSLRSMPNDRST